LTGLTGKDLGGFMAHLKQAKPELESLDWIDRQEQAALDQIIAGAFQKYDHL
jgi:hypothetical protein